MIPLNQVYKEKDTLEQYPSIRDRFNNIKEFTIKNGFVRENGTPKGRIYDYSVLLEGIDIKNKTIAEIGGRDGILSGWLTQFADKVYVSDYFFEWDGLGDFQYWSDKWMSAAINKDKLVTETQDGTKLTYEDNMFDIVISTSVIEHMFPQNEYRGDMTCIRELARITKPGGYILLSTDMAEHSGWQSGTYHYDKIDLFDRIINPSRCELVGEYDFDINGENNTDMHTFCDLEKATSVIFRLRKPE